MGGHLSDRADRFAERLLQRIKPPVEEPEPEATQEEKVASVVLRWEKTNSARRGLKRFKELTEK